MAAGKKFILIITLYFLSIAGSVRGQFAYMNTQQGIYQLTIGANGCDRTLVANGCGIDNSILSLAVYKDTVYYNTWNGELKRFRIGFPGSCETLIDGGPSYNAMTVDKNGIIYMAQEELAMYDPHTRQLTNLGRMPFYSAGDILFFNDKLLLAGYDPSDWSTGIYEINPNNLSASRLYFSTPDFIGLLAYPAPCGNNRYFGLSCHNTGTTWLTALDLENKTVIGDAGSIPADILDAASITEIGLNDKVTITGLQVFKSCQAATANVSVNAVYPGNGTISFTLDNNVTNTSGSFDGVAPGQHLIHVSSPGAICAADTIFTVASSSELISDVKITNPDYCLDLPGKVQITSQSNALLTFTLLNSGLKQSSGSFGGLRGGMYHFRVEDATGCSKDTLVIITEKIPIGGCDTIFIPNAFTPNNDGKNDRYIVDLPSTYKDMVLQIFNRWGTIVYQEKGNSVSWDGSYKGIQQPPGVYIYSLRYTGRDNARKILKGTLTLIR